MYVVHFILHNQAFIFNVFSSDRMGLNTNTCEYITANCQQKYFHDFTINITKVEYKQHNKCYDFHSAFIMKEFQKVSLGNSKNSIVRQS